MQRIHKITSERYCNKSTGNGANNWSADIDKKINSLYD